MVGNIQYQVSAHGAQAHHSKLCFAHKIYLLKYFPINGIFASSFASIFPTNQVKKINNARPVPKEKSKEADTH